jgi:hypothetical protein
MNEKMKFVLVEMDETDIAAEKLAAVGLNGVVLGFESDDISKELFEAAPDLRDALAMLYSFCNSTSVYMSIPTRFLDQAEMALRRANRKDC